MGIYFKNIKIVFIFIFYFCVLSLRAISGTESDMAAPTFVKVYSQFMCEMGLTFPELEKACDKAIYLGWKDFSKSVKPILHQIATRDSAIFTEEGVEIAPRVVMTKKLWKDAGKETHKAVWDFLSSLVLLASYEEKLSSKNTVDEPDFTNFFDISGADVDLKKMFESLGKQFSNKSFTSFFDGIKEAAESMKDKFTGLSGEGLPKIPERLFKGHIAKIAEDLAKEFKPEDFGLSPEVLDSNDTGATFEYLQQIFTKNPDLLMKGAKKIAQRIQDKLQKGQVRREDLVAEAEELMKEFQNNTMFKQIFEQLSSQLKNMGGDSGPNSQSERLRATKERLRKKAEAKAEAKKNSSNGPNNMD